MEQVIARGHPAQGQEAASLERSAAAWFGAADSAVCGSGSQALLLAMLALGLEEGARVAIPAFTCSAVLYAVLWAGAEPVFLDNSEGGIAPDPASMEATGPVDAVILVHPWGQVLLADEWRPAARILIEDWAQSIGGRSERDGAGRSGDASVVSFYATKMLCGGEGGLVAAPAPAIDRIRDLRDYDGQSGPGRRFNFKMSDLSAAMARTQWGRLEEFMSRRTGIAERYLREIPSMGLTPVVAAEGTTPSWYRFLCWSPVEVGPIVEECERNGVHCRRPVPIMLEELRGTEPLPNTLEAWHRLLSIPIYPTLTQEEQTRVLETISNALRKAGSGA